MKKIISIILIATLAITTVPFFASACDECAREEIEKIINAFQGTDEVSFEFEIDYETTQTPPVAGTANGKVECKDGKWGFYVRNADGTHTSITTTATNSNNANNAISQELQHFINAFPKLDMSTYEYEGTLGSLDDDDGDAMVKTNEETPRTMTFVFVDIEMCEIQFEDKSMKVSNPETSTSLIDISAVIAPENQMWLMADAARGAGEISFEFELEYETTQTPPVVGTAKGRVECKDGKWGFYVLNADGTHNSITTTAANSNNVNNAISQKLQKISANLVNMTRNGHAHDNIVGLNDNIPALFGSALDSNGFYHEGYAFAKTADSKIRFTRTATSVPPLVEGEDALIEYDSWADVPYADVNASAWRNSSRVTPVDGDGALMTIPNAYAAGNTAGYMLFIHNNNLSVENGNRDLRGIISDGAEIKVDNFKTSTALIDIPAVMAPENQMWQIVDAARGIGEISFDFELDCGEKGTVECKDGVWGYFDEDGEEYAPDDEHVEELEHFTANFVSMTRNGHAHDNIAGLNDNVPELFGAALDVYGFYHEGYAFAKTDDSKIRFTRTATSVPPLVEGEDVIIEYDSWSDVPYANVNASAWRNSARVTPVNGEGELVTIPNAYEAGITAGYMLFVHNNNQSVENPNRELRGIMFDGEEIKVDNLKDKAFIMSGITTYTVTVNGSYASSSGAGKYVEGDTVTIRAGLREDGISFKNWTVTSGDVVLAYEDSATTAFTMPAGNVTITANWNVTSACDCDRIDCPDCNPNGTYLALGDIDGEGGITIFDALEILKYLVGMGNAMDDNPEALRAAIIRDSGFDSGKPTIFCALEVLKFLVNMNSKVDGVHIHGTPTT